MPAAASQRHPGSRSRASAAGHRARASVSVQRPWHCAPSPGRRLRAQVPVPPQVVPPLPPSTVPGPSWGATGSFR
eukprot:8827651-Alexandrium_andersonii.AAC.1